MFSRFSCNRFVPVVRLFGLGPPLAALLSRSRRLAVARVADRIVQSLHTGRLRGLLTKGAVFGRSRFYGIQRGPTSPGRTWLLHATNVSITPYTYTEDFTHDDAVLSRDNLKIAFRVHTVWRIDDTRIPLFSSGTAPRCWRGSAAPRPSRMRL